MAEVDSHYVIGNGHKVCQDYSRINNNSAVISDGCSSTKDSDLGSRILTLRALDGLALDFDFTKTESYTTVVKNAYDVVSNLGKPLCLDATLGMLKLNNGVIEAHSYGDSVIVIKKEWGYIIQYLDFTTGYPAYPSYCLGERFKHYENVRGLVNFNLANYTNDFVNMSKIISPFTHNHISVYNDADHVEWAAIVSDGIHSFQDEHKQSINLETIIPELFAFKTFKGEFVHRRMKRYLTDVAKKGWTHYDDLSIAVIKP